MKYMPIYFFFLNKETYFLHVNLLVVTSGTKDNQYFYDNTIFVVL